MSTIFKAVAVVVVVVIVGIPGFSLYVGAWYTFINGSFEDFEEAERAALTNVATAPAATVDEAVPEDAHWVDLIGAKRLKLVRVDGKYLYLDPQSQRTIALGELRLSSFSDRDYFNAGGLAQVKVNGSAVWINLKGQEVTLPGEQQPGDYRDWTLFNANGKYGWKTRQGEIAIPPRFDDTRQPFDNEGLVAVHEKGDGWYKINTKGQEAVPLRELKNMNLNFAVNGLAAYRSYEKYGYINKEGIVVIPRRFDTATEFAPNGLALVSAQGKWGYLDTQGNEITHLRFDYAEVFANNGLATVKLDGKIGWINDKGKIVIPMRFDSTLGFTEDGVAKGLARVEIDGKYGYINIKGETVIPLRFEEMTSFAANGLARVKENENDKYGYINTTGKMMIPPRFDEASGFGQDGLARVREHETWFNINAQGETVKGK
ncbi:hypothetical protein AGMMS50289_22280 [Betaproteobacteria bacterium]|nr:hypothetical protein AGMMS50289_22280 [Betaproteobacteria bacterium]